MDQRFWNRSPDRVAKDLLGMVMILGHLEAVILRTKPFLHDEHNQPLYFPMEGMEPGSVYCPRLMLYPLLVFVAKDGRVLIEAIEVDGRVIDGPGRTARRLGIHQGRLQGTTRFLDEGTIEVSIQGPLQQEPLAQQKPRKKVEDANGIGMKELKRLMPRVVDAFFVAQSEQARRTLRFDDFVNGLLRESHTAAELRRKLTEYERGREV